MPDAQSAVHWAVTDGVAIVRIDRPAQRNALNLAVKSALCDAIVTLDADSAIGAIILAGAGGRFVSGTDIAEMANMTPADHERFDTGRIFAVAAACRTPLIAAIEKHAFGGGLELALCCDIIVAGHGAKLGLPEIRLGIMPGGGGSQRMARCIGPYRTMRHILTGDPFTGEDAAAMGLASFAVSDDAVLDTAIDLARRIATMSRGGVRAIKSAMQAGASASLTDALAAERAAFVGLFGSEDQLEGMRAFLEKRPPRFAGFARPAA